MASVIFQNSDDTNLHDGSTSITENNLHWLVLDTADASTTTAVVDKGNNLNISTGTGTITTSAGTGSKIVLVQSPTTAAIGAYIMTVTT